jgi:N-acetylneuraminate lyase
MGAFSGIWPALVTPLTAEGQVDAAATEGLIEALLATGIGGLYVCGGTGEGVLLPPAVRREMAELAVSVVAGRVPVMVHVGSINTEVAVELAQHANLVSADAISAVPPFYYEYPFHAIREHYQAIAQVSQAPLYVYYIPGATGNPISPDQLLEICALDGVAGLKFTSRDMYYFSQLMARRNPESVNVLSGPDELFLSCQVLGAEGAIGTTYNVMPRLYLDIRASAAAGDVVTARSLQFGANAVIDVLLRHSIIPATKALLGMIGLKVGHGMPPMPPIGGDRARALRHDLEDAGYFALLERSALHGPAGDPMRGRLA